MNQNKGIKNRCAYAVFAVIVMAFLSGCAGPAKMAVSGKLNHVSLFWMKEPGNIEHRQKLIAAAHSFAREIPEVQFLSIGQTLPKTSPFTDASFDICFVMRFENKAALNRYGKHPVHTKAAKEVFLPISDKILFYDLTSE